MLFYLWRSTSIHFSWMINPIWLFGDRREATSVIWIKNITWLIKSSFNPLLNQWPIGGLGSPLGDTPRSRGERYYFPWIAPLTLDPYFIMLSVKQGSIKYYFLSLWYDSTRGWTPVPRATGEYSNHYAKEPVFLFSHSHLFALTYGFK